MHFLQLIESGLLTIIRIRYWLRAGLLVAAGLVVVVEPVNLLRLQHILLDQLGLQANGFVLVPVPLLSLSLSIFCPLPL